MHKVSSEMPLYCRIYLRVNGRKGDVGSELGPLIDKLAFDLHLTLITNRQESESLAQALSLHTRAVPRSPFGYFCMYRTTLSTTPSAEPASRL